MNMWKIVDKKQLGLEKKVNKFLKLKNSFKDKNMI